MIRVLIISLLFIFNLHAQDIWYVNFNNSSGTYNGLTSATGWNFFDINNGYDSNPTGVDWTSISAGDTILVSGTYRPDHGYGRMIYGTTITGGQVIIKEDWHTGYGSALFQNSDSLVTFGSWTGQQVEANVDITNTVGLKFIGLTFRVNEPRPPYSNMKSKNLNLENDSLITFEDCHFITNGVAGNIGMTNCAVITFDDCLIESQFNYYTEDNDLFTWEQSGFGQHTIKDCEIINRNAYVGTSHNGTGVTTDSTASYFSVTLSGGTYPTNRHKFATLSMGSAYMLVDSNNATTFYGKEWNDGDDPPTIVPMPADGIGYTIASTAHRDVMQMGYGNNPSRPTTKFINNFIWVLYEQDVNSWNQLHYLGANAEDICIQDFVYINNLFVCPIDTNGNGVAVISQNWDNALAKSKWEFYNNTFIATAGWFGNTQAMDSCIAYNNIFVTLNRNSTIRLARSDEVSVDSINYNYWSVPNWLTRTWTDGHPFLWDDYQYYDWAEWQSAGNDINSSRDVSGTMNLQSVKDSVITAYYTTAGRDAGRNLSYLATKYPEIMYDILGNPRSGTWCIGALEYPDSVTTPRRVRMRQIIIQ